MEYLTEEDREYGTLAGMTYYKEQSNGSKLVFGSQVCMPGMDGGALLKLELSIGDWNLKIMRDETADVDVDPLQYEEEGVWELTNEARAEDKFVYPMPCKEKDKTTKWDYKKKEKPCGTVVLGGFSFL